MELIDILNMISKGELKEGTKVIYKETKFEYERLELEDDEGYSIMYSVNDILDLSGECEIIEPEHFTDVGKMEKIEELEDSDVLNLPYRTIKFSMDERAIQMYFSEVVRRLKMHNDKLNEVIRRINNVR